MADMTDNAALCREVLEWTQIAPANEVLAWETKAGLIESTPDFEHNLAAAMRLIERVCCEGSDRRWQSDYDVDRNVRYVVWIHKDFVAQAYEAEGDGDTLAQAITRAVWALVNDKAVKDG